MGTFSAVNAGIVSAAGLASAAAGGEAVERLAKENSAVDARMYVAAVSSVLAAFAWAATVKSGSFNVALGLLAVEYLVGEVS